MDKELIKQLLKALKPQSSTPVVNGTMEGLPELPSLEGEIQQPPTPMSDPVQAPAVQNSDNGFSLDRKGLNFKSDLADILVNHKGLKLESDRLNGNIGYDGSVGINGNLPFNGGQIGAGYNSKDGNRNFNLNATKRMLGGDVSLDFNNDNGNRSGYIRYGRTF